YALQALEPGFRQDLNGDGTIGLHVMTIEQSGATALMQVADTYALDGALGPQIKYNGASVTVAQFGAWTPIGAEQIAFGYEVAWRLGAADQYMVWSIDNSGNCLGNATGVVSGSDLGFETLETSFQQDLNGDGQIGPTVTSIEAFGATRLVERGNQF